MTKQNGRTGYLMRASILITLCLVLTMTGTAMAEETTPVVVSNPPINRTLYPSPDVPESDPVDDSYFADAVFIGDSILSGLEIYDIVPQAKFATEIGTSVRRVHKHHTIQYEKIYYTMIDYAMLSNPQKVYIMLGTNGINIVKPSQVLDDMRELVAYIVETWPTTLVYLIDVPPVRPAVTKKQPRLSNKNIVIYNEGLREVAEEYQIFYLHTNPLFVQEDGALDRSMAAKDGYHMVEKAHVIFGEYLYTHTIPIDENLQWLVQDTE